MLIESLKNRLHSTRSELLSVSAPAILISSIIFLFGPFIIYIGNISEFQVSLLDILKYYAIPGVILTVIFLLPGMLISKKYLSIYVSLLFVTAILLWIQGNFLVWEYGLLDGQHVEWSDNKWRGWVDGLLWALLLSIASIFHRIIYKISTVACIIIMFIQVLNLGFVSYEKREIWAANEGFPLSHPPPEEIYEFSSEQNVIQFILDAFQSDIFQEIIDGDPDYYNTSLDGFTFFKEATGSFPTTYMSYPAILSGKNYKNQIPMPEFVKGIMSGKTVPNTLYDNGYDVDLVCGAQLGRFSNAYSIPVPYGQKKEEYDRAKSAMMMDLVLFRHAPHFLKKQIYANQSWLLQSLVNGEITLQLPPLNHQSFLEDLIRNMTIKRKKRVYKFIHLYTTHLPMVMNEDCEYVGRVLPYSRKNIKIQCKCGLDHFIAFLEKLKSLGLYDSSLIILQADHGAGKAVKMEDGCGQEKERYIEELVGSAIPLLAIKQPHSKGTLKVSNAQATLTDLPATIMEILDVKEDFPGKSVFKIDPKKNRERRYYNYKWLRKHWQADFFSRLDEYVINGSVFDKASWRLGKIFNPPGQNSYETGEIDFGTENAYRFLLSGWSSAESDRESGLTFTWALGNSSSILMSLPKNEAVRLEANLKTLRFSKPQRISIRVDQQTIGTWEISPSWHWEKHSIIIGADKDRSEVSVIEFIFSQHHTEGKDLRPLAVLFDSITLHKLESVN